MSEGNFKRVDGKVIEVNDLKMYYEEYGEGFPLILIHGGASSIQMWEHQLPVYAKHFKVIAVDCRGQGKTDNPGGEFHYRQMADDFAELIEKLGYEKALINGWSDGAQIALELGMHYPNKIKAMIVGGALLHVSQLMIEGMETIGIEAGHINYAKLLERLPWFADLLQKYHSSVYGKDYWKTMLLNISKMWMDSKEFLGDKVKEISTPALILQGDRDDYIPISESLTMHELMPNTELAIIPDSNHDVYATKVKIYNEITIDYLTRQLPSKD
ncbi:MAG: alpha/beta fold hydrolase [Candidatus Heimdallarchaeota archaeon]